MKLNQRPLPVTILGCIYIAVGTVGFAYYLTEFRTLHAFPSDGVWIELTELLAVLCGGFMLRGRNWARWLALAWMAFHVVLSFFHAFQEFAIHCLFFAAIAWFLLRPETARYFHSGRVKPT